MALPWRDRGLRSGCFEDFFARFTRAEASLNFRLVQLFFCIEAEVMESDRANG